MILLCKGTCSPVAPSFNGQGGLCPHNAPPVLMSLVVCQGISGNFQIIGKKIT